ncbi:hypothetical protein BT93_K0417 [Corymbia citriodora subsp. variegata]|nr:hypothetical protein BT93_K0417 [Corymbia citriodora subsp. variegata]
MVGQGIVAYRDSEELHAGDRIDNLLRAVRNSKICIPVLSRGYASSAWCLRELACVIELNKSTKKPEILPIFFDVMPSDVKLKTKLYVEDLVKHKQRPDGESKEQWEVALRTVAEIKGWEVPRKPYGEVIDLVVKEVLRKLKVKQRPLDSKLVGADEQVETIMKLLDVDSGIGVRFIGIHGMVGIGKTTLAKIVYNELCLRFDGQCSFIENIRESSNKDGLVHLQKKLASDIFGSTFIETFINTDEGIDSIRKRARSKKVLLVLDDLDKKEQLKKLVGGLDTFDSGSIIIITTRDKRIMDEVQGILSYEAKQMDHDKALELFILHAFNNVSPRDGFQSLSREIVLTTGGLPLALEVIGSYLRHKDEKIWKEMPKRLKNIPHGEVRDRLKISYNALGDEEKEIFLDITCFFIDEKKSMATYFWDACSLYPHCALKELTDLCLIKIVRGDVIWMHDQLRDLGRDIVRQECIRNLTARSRLWNVEEALEVVKSKKEKDKVRGLNLVEHGLDTINIGDEELKWMPNLKFLKLKAGTFVGDINNYLLELRWLSWDYPPLDHRMAKLHLKKLVVFKLSNNKNSENWGGWNILQMANQLKVLFLLGCSGLKRTPNLSRCLSLERLTLQNCSNLKEVDSSIEKLKGLTHLEIMGCNDLQNLPKEIGGLRNLKHLCIIQGSKMEKLPSSIGELTQLEFLSLIHCKNLRKLPKSIGDLTSLLELDLSGTNIVELPDSIKNFKQLKVMSLKNSSIRRLPAGIGMLTRLEKLDASYCSQLVGELPTEIGKLSSLNILNLSFTGVCAVPTSINSLVRLQKLYLDYCVKLQELPKLPPSLNCLCVKLASLRLVPNLNNLTNLVELCLSSRFGEAVAQASNPIQTLQFQWIGKLSQLEILEWELLDVSVPSMELGCLPRLRDLTIPGMDDFNTIIIGPQLSNLKNLSRLCLHKSPLREIQLDGLELLRNLVLRYCMFMEKLSIISSSLRKLCKMEVADCPKLLEIRFLDTMESLEEFRVIDCSSLGGLCGLSNTKKLKTLKICRCDGLQVVEGLEELELLKNLEFLSSGLLERLIDVCNSKIPNECQITKNEWVTGLQFISFGEFRERILDGTGETFNEESEMEKDSEDSMKENDSIDCSDSKDSTKEKDRIDRSNLEGSTKEKTTLIVRIQKILQRRTTALIVQIQKLRLR